MRNRGPRARLLLAAVAALPVGCDRDGDPDPSPPAAAVSLPSEPLTFTRHIAPIIFENCSRCHRPGEAGPFDLLTYEDVRKRASQIVMVTSDRFMPPWIPVPGYGSLAGERRLTETQIALLEHWVEQGAAEGDPADLPPRPQWPQGWQLGEPDLIVSMPEPFSLAPGDEDVFRNFVIPIPVEERRYVRAMEFRSDNPKVIHHADMRIDRTRGSRERDERDPEPGFEGMDAAGSAQFPDGTLLGWTPGKVASQGPEDLAWRLEKDSDLVLGLHLLPSGKPETVSATIGLFFTDEPPTRYPYSLRLGSMTIDIPAGERDYVIEDSYVLPVDVEVVGIYPHAHYLGHTMRGTATLPDGTTRPLIRIDDWDFNWQDQYWYTEPVFLPKGTTVSMRYSYDNSADNVRNPTHPPRRVIFGGRSSDEMGDLWLQVVPRTARDLEILKADFERKEVNVRIAGLLMKLESDPDDFESHHDLALMYLRLGDAANAVTHFEHAVRIEPGFGGGYYNLGLVRAAQQRHAEAITYFMKALEATPDLADAHNAWGNALIAQGRLDAAAAHYRQALQIDGQFALAHFNLGAIADARGNTDEAIACFRRAATLGPDSARIQSTLGRLLLEQGDVVDALPFLERAVYLRPDAIDDHVRLAQALISNGQADRAVPSLREAVRLAPDSVRLLNDLAWILATHPDDTVRDATQAVTLAERAARMTGRRDASVLDTLAAAYAGAGRFTEAVGTAQSAQQLAPHDPDLAAHLQAYLDGTPYLDASLTRRSD